MKDEGLDVHILPESGHRLWRFFAVHSIGLSVYDPRQMGKFLRKSLEIILLLLLSVRAKAV